VAPGVTRDVRACGVATLDGVRPIRVVDRAGHDYCARARQHPPHVGAAVSRSREIRHATRVPARDPLVEERQLAMRADRREAAEIEPDGSRIRLDVRCGDHGIILLLPRGAPPPLGLPSLTLRILARWSLLLSQHSVAISGASRTCTWASRARN